MNYIHSVVYSPDEQHILSASRDGTAKVWNAVTGELLISLDHGLVLYKAVYTPDGRYIISIPGDSNPRVWNAATGQEEATLEGYLPAYSPAISPDSERIVTFNYTLGKILSLPNGEQIAVIEGHTDSINSAMYNSDGTLIATASRDNTVRVWDGINGNPIAVLHGFGDLESSP